MTTSLIEVLDLPNFGHMVTSTVLFESRNKFLLMTSQNSQRMTSQLLIQNTFILRRARVAIFADILTCLFRVRNSMTFWQT